MRFACRLSGDWQITNCDSPRIFYLHVTSETSSGVCMRCKWVGLALLMAACTAHEQPQNPEERCAKLRDHLVDLRLEDVRGSAAGLDLDAHRAAMKRALGSDFIAECAARMSETQLDCAMASRTLSASNDCVDGSASRVAAGGVR